MNEGELEDCPYCDNSGYYMGIVFNPNIQDACEREVECRWCRVNPKSKFNYYYTKPRKLKRDLDKYVGRLK